VHLDAAKQHVQDEVDRRAELLLDASHRIHEHPELAFTEHFAHALLTDAIEQAGLHVERGAYGLDTAFVATAGTSGPTIAVLCEYDALPGIGHACGHNIIAAAGLGAGLAAATLADEAGGRVRIMGTPAEENGGGKVAMLDVGAFDGVDAALMVHPAGRDLRTMTTLAVAPFKAVYSGEAAHAAAAPHKGRNALDAAVLGYVNVAALRQHIRPDERVHGIFTEAGDRPNIVPKRAVAEWFVRAPTTERLDALRARVVTCLQAGADAAGCTMQLEWDPHPYAEVRDNGPLLDLYAANSEVLGRPLSTPAAATSVTGSTDMGNVSHAVPSIHPMIQVSTPDVAIHTPAFAAFAAQDPGDRAVIDGAKAMAMTVADLWLGEGRLDEVRDAFAAATSSR
jgi:amidohydrolase